LNEEIVYCGIDCSLCPAYLATKSNDVTKLEEVATLFSTKERKFTANDIICNGCISTRIYKWALECPTRNCARDKNVVNCGQCKNYPCKSLEFHWKQSGEQGVIMKNNLDKLRN
jgi:hypothetical protein